ncbi:MAG TPA: mucoidy inhibitor MuiA family protein, partial [Gemmataceae bacterium]|nr:mucoidy inhibitor MuiA family protein [Gemmataceae bacterium]
AALASVALVGVVGFLARSTQAQEATSAKNADASRPTSKLASSRIDRVTVYPQNALVTREVEVPAGNGLIELTIPAMPDQIVPSTMYSEGSSGLRVLTTRFSTRQVLEDTSEERRKLEAEKDKHMVIGSKIASEMTSLQNNIALLAKLEGTATEKSSRTGDEVIAIAKYVMEQRLEKNKDMVQLQEQKRVNDIQLNFIARKMAELGRGGGKVEREAVIVVDREAGQGGKVRLNYLVSSVTWRPEYKVRAGKVNEDVQVDYLANLMQHSGEDWNQAKITLSTAQPMLNASPPELCMLQPILVTRGVPGGVPMPAGGPAPFAQPGASGALLDKANTLRLQAGRNYRDGSVKAQLDAAKDLNDAASYEQNLELMQTPAQVLANLKKGEKQLAGPAGMDGPSVT